MSKFGSPPEFVLGVWLFMPDNYRDEQLRIYHVFPVIVF